MKPEPFKMTQSTRALLGPVLDKLDEADRAKLMDALASLAAEVQIYSIQVAMERLRQEWADSLATMLRHEPRPKKEDR